MQTTIAMLATRISISVLLFGILVFWNSQVSAQELTDAQKEVWKTIEAYYENLIMVDVEAIMTANHEDNLEWWTNKKRPYGKNDLRANYHSQFAYDKPLSYKLEPLNINILHDVAVVYYKHKWNGNILSAWNRQISTFIKQNNKWKSIGGMACPCDTRPNCE